MMLQSIALTLPEVILSTAALILMLVAAWGGDKAAKVIAWLAIACFIAAAITVPGTHGPQSLGFNGLFVSDSFAAFSKIGIYIAAACALVAATGWFGRDGDYRAEYPVLILLSGVGMGIMVSAADLLTLYVGLELQSLAAYVLASFQRRDNRSAEAGLKYFVLGALASGILLYGISLVYGFAGTTLFSGIAEAYRAVAAGTPAYYGLMFGLVFIFTGIAFKMAAVPFHMWTPDVYEGAPTPVTAFFASSPTAP